MNRPTPQILVCAEDQAVCTRVQGRADVSISVAFKKLLNGLRDKGFRHFELELSECQMMDSTFLGVLCGFAQKCDATSISPPILFNPNERITGLLTSLGVNHLFEFRQGTSLNTGECTNTNPSEVTPSREQLKSTSLEAHRTLMALNPDNVAKFKDLTEFLAEDLRKLRGGP